jgi:hypothetical protein
MRTPIRSAATLAAAWKHGIASRWNRASVLYLVEGQMRLFQAVRVGVMIRPFWRRCTIAIA